MSKRILFSVFAAVIFWSTAIVFAQEQAPAPVFKEGDTWQFNIARKGQIASSTDQNDGMYELSVTQGAVKLYEMKNPAASSGVSKGLYDNFSEPRHPRMF